MMFPPNCVSLFMSCYADETYALALWACLMMKSLSATTFFSSLAEKPLSRSEELISALSLMQA